MDGNKVDDGHCQHLCSALTCYHALCKSAPDNAFVIGATYRGTRPESSLRAEVTRAHQAPDLRCSPWMIPQRSNHVYKVSRRRDDVCVTPQDRKPTQWYGQLVATTRQAYARCATQRDEGFFHANYPFICMFIRLACMYCSLFMFICSWMFICS